MKTNKGFTLIELLVVITIIGVLAGIATVSLSNSKGKSRDARRISEMEALRDATEKYIQDNFKLPVNGLSDLSASYFGGKLPTDPQTGASYGYYATSTYYIGAKMEVITATGANICPTGFLALYPTMNYCLPRTN